MSHADLSHSDVSGADFTGATLLWASLHAVKDRGTIWGASKSSARPPDMDRLNAEGWMPPKRT